MANLKSALKNAKDQDEMAWTHKEEPSFDRHDQSRMSKLFTILSKSRYTLDILRSFPPNWELMNKLYVNIVGADINIKVICHEYLLGYMILYHWLEGLVEKAMSGVIRLVTPNIEDSLLEDPLNHLINDLEDDSNTEEVPSHGKKWYHALAKDVYNNIKNGHRNVTYSPATYYHRLPSISNINSCNIEVSFASSTISTREMQEEVFEQLIQILSYWLGFPKNTETYAKARFLFIVVTYISPGALYLDETYAAFTRLKFLLFTRQTSKFCQSNFGCFIARIRSHSLVDKFSCQRKTLDELERIYNKWYSPLALSLPAEWIPERMG